MEPVKPPLKSTDKMHMLPMQEKAYRERLDEILNYPDRVASIWWPFAPTTSWIQEFRKVGYGFLPNDAYTEFELRKLPIEAEKDPEPWVPQNGEKIQASYPSAPRSEDDWIDVIYIGRDGEDYVVRSGREYVALTHVRQRVKTQVPLAELLSVYASVKGLTQDGVELKPEN